MNTEVTLHDKARVTVPVFDVKSMILALLTDPNLMNNAILLKGTIYSVEMLIKQSIKPKVQ
jgi:hypothetical protein